MNILIFEYCFDDAGHRVPYASLIAQAIVAAGHDIVVAFPSKIRNSDSINEYFHASEELAANSVGIHFFETSVCNSAREKAKQIVRDFDAVVNEIQPDYAIVPTGDLFAIACAMEQFVWFKNRVSRIPIDVLLMRGDFAYRHNRTFTRIVKRLKWWMSARLKWHRLSVLDPIVWQLEKENMPELELCPDPVPPKPNLDKLSARHELGLPPDGKILISVGNQNETKGVDLLLRAFSSEPSNSNHFLVLVGPMTRRVQEVFNLCSTHTNIISINRFVSESEFQRALLSADVVAVPYRKTDRPSGIICRCVAWGIPILGSNTGWPNWACEKYSAGIAVDIRNRKQFVEAINNSLEHSDDFKRSQEAATFCRFNSESNFKKFWTAGIKADSAGYEPLEPVARIEK